MTTATAAATGHGTTTTTRGRGTYTLREVAALFGVSHRTVCNWVRAGRFPRPLPVSPNKFLWAAADVERVLAGRAGAARGGR
jgi:predicted DNA-binding transcriptional regulator AlpA